MTGGPVAPRDLDLAALERIAVDVACSAGALIVEGRPDRLDVEATKSSHTDIVTVMDQRAQDHLLDRLAEVAPDDGVFGEEEGARLGTSGITWVVDPIDGTVNYLYEIGAYAVSVAAVVGDPSRPGAWRPVAGAVVNPVTGEVYSAARGRGSTRRVGAGAPERLVAPARADDLSVALVATGFAYAAPTRAWQGELVARLLPRVRDVRRIGSAALDLCRLADGQVDAYYETGLQPWDLAAGWLVATEAGVVVGGPGGQPRDDADPPTTALTWGANARIAAAFGPMVAGLTRSLREA